MYTYTYIYMNIFYGHICINIINIHIYIQTHKKETKRENTSDMCKSLLSFTL